MGSIPARTSVYEKIKEQLDPGDLIRRLGLELVRTLGSEAYCKPLCHESTSGESLQINLHTGAWNCKACQHAGVYGDLFQLVEYAIHGGMTPTHGVAQKDSPTHRAAIDWLCGQFGIAYKKGQGYADPALDVVHLFAMHAFEYLQTRPDVLDWIGKKWGFDAATIASHSIGFIPSPLPVDLAKEALQSSSKGAFKSSGIGWYDRDKGGAFRTRFEGRVIFPYLENGQAVYLIGRATPWTPKRDGDEYQPKYHKLSVHSDRRKWISEKVSNDHLYLEPVLRNTDRVVVAEGVADAVALSSLGIPVVSPVTVSFNATDIERFTAKAKENGIARVEILFDNELSGSGGFGARRAGRQLVERGLSVSILTLPLGPEQEAARDEVVKALGDEGFAEFEAAPPAARKRIIEAIEDEGKRAWIIESITGSKIDAAEWVAEQGAGAAGRFNQIRKAGRDVVDLEIEDDARDLDPEGDALERLAAFEDSIALAAHVDEAMLRDGYARGIAAFAGKGVTKAAVLQRIGRVRKETVKPNRKETKARKAAQDRPAAPDLILPPPNSGHVRPTPPAAPGSTGEGGASPGTPQPPAEGLSKPSPNAPRPPSPLTAEIETEHESLAHSRDTVARCIDAKVHEERVGEYIADTMIRSMGYTPFLTPAELFLVRGNERILVGRKSPAFATLVYLVAGLSWQKSAHRSYIDVAMYFLNRSARKTEDVSWSHVDPEGAIFFPTGDGNGQLLRISPAKVERTRMMTAKVPAVAGADFHAFNYTEEGGGIDEAIDAFRWTSLSGGDRMVLIYWLAILPILRRIGTVPIVRIEGGSSSGKTRAVDGVSFLVNGAKSSSVPTAAALISRMSVEMLTIDDNREVGDVTPAFLGTLLQATSLGAREKRQGNSDTGTVVERVCGGLLMNGIEPIHSGRSELASRMLVLRCEPSNRSDDSPTANPILNERLVALRDRFWSEAVRRCSTALEYDAEHGERIGAEIEKIFGETRIGRLSNYIRLMYFSHVAGLPEEYRDAALKEVSQNWKDALGNLGGYALSSLVREELSVAAVRYAFDYGRAVAEAPYVGADAVAFDGKYQRSDSNGDEVLGPFTAPQLARWVRSAGKELNAPRSVTVDLRAGQLEARVLDGIGFLKAAGIDVAYERTSKGKVRFTFYRGTEAGGVIVDGGGTADTWRDPDQKAG